MRDDNKHNIDDTDFGRIDNIIEMSYFEKVPQIKLEKREQLGGITLWCIAFVFMAVSGYMLHNFVTNKRYDEINQY